MQVAINPDLYGTAQMYAEKKGLNLTTLIEDFLVRFISTKETSKEEEVPDVVLSLLGAANGQIANEDLNGRNAYYQHIEEKYQ
jgi:hypothetical protein